MRGASCGVLLDCCSMKRSDDGQSDDLDDKWNVVWNYQTQQSFRPDRDFAAFRIL